MMEPWSPEWKQLRYEELKEVWQDCQKCGLCKDRKKMVFGEGDLNARLMFIGEGPGKEEDQTGHPFWGDSGKLLMTMLEFVGIKREDIFLDNIVICRPPGNRDPLRQEKEACLQRLYQAIYLVDPLIVVAVGKVALEALAGRSWSIEKEHGVLFSSPGPDVRVPGERNGVSIPGKFFPRKGPSKKDVTLEYDMVPIYHPAYILRQDSYDEDKKEFAHGGIAHQTLSDLEGIIKRLNYLEKEYQITNATIERMST